MKFQQYLGVDLKRRHNTSFRRWLKGQGSGSIIKEFVSAERYFLKQWLESMFTEGMTWKNYGDVWVVDHIVPVSLFDLSKREELKICWHYKNLMPLLKEDNLKKESNTFFAFELLVNMDRRDFIYDKLIERILPEVKSMIKYLDKHADHIERFTEKTKRREDTGIRGYFTEEEASIRTARV
jgi:hypothetical protein